MNIVWLIVMWKSLSALGTNLRAGCGCLLPATVYLLWILIYGLLRQL